jgi:hypothetical protein
MKIRATAIPLDKDVHEPGIVISADDARQGETGGRMLKVPRAFCGLGGRRHGNIPAVRSPLEAHYSSDPRHAAQLVSLECAP